MDEIQRKCLTTAQEGHNLLITGQAGTGKTKIIKTIIATLKQQGKKVMVTAPTGLAANLYEGGCTIHR